MRVDSSAFDCSNKSENVFQTGVFQNIQKWYVVSFYFTYKDICSILINKPWINVMSLI